MEEIYCVLSFLLAQTQTHFEQHSTVEESQCVLGFLFAQTQAHFKKQHSIVEES
jgi:hypothetical protein